MNNVDNYRVITLLITLGKIFTSLLNAGLNQFANEINSIGNKQAGFRKGQSTTDQILSLKCLIDLYLKKQIKIILHIHRLRKSIQYYKPRRSVVQIIKKWHRG